MNVKTWLQSLRGDAVKDAPVSTVQKPLRSPYSHRGFMVTSMNFHSIQRVREQFQNLWYQHHRRSGIEPPISAPLLTFNDHYSVAVFPCGGNQVGLTYVGETQVHDLFEQLLHVEFPDCQFIRFMFDHESASISGHSGAE